MYLSNPKRVQKVLFYLATRPWDIPYYFLYSLRKCSPLEVAKPWWSLPAIKYVSQKISANSRVFEWGSGGSTLFLGQTFKHITSIEHDATWLRMVKTKLEENQLTNVNLIQPEIDLTSQNSFEQSEYLHTLDQSFDLIVIDGEDHFGPGSSWSARVSCFDRAESFISKGGCILVDDSWRYPEIRDRSNAKDIKILEGIGPCRKGVTSTDLHLY